MTLPTGVSMFGVAYTTCRTSAVGWVVLCDVTQVQLHLHTDPTAMPVTPSGPYDLIALIGPSWPLLSTIRARKRKRDKEREETKGREGGEKRERGRERREGERER